MFQRGLISKRPVGYDGKDIYLVTEWRSNAPPLFVLERRETPIKIDNPFLACPPFVEWVIHDVKGARIGEQEHFRDRHEAHDYCETLTGIVTRHYWW